MTVKIDTDAEINSVRLKDQGSNPSNPAGGYKSVFAKTDGLYLINASGTVVGPYVPDLSLSSISISGSNVTASVNTRYFIDVSTLTADRNFIIPAGSMGDKIEINITSGDDTYELVIIGDTGITINGGVAATEWSRLFITSETIRLIATSTTNWQVVQDGRIPCRGRLSLSGNEAVNGAGTATVPTWDVADINIGSLADLVNYQFVVRRSGYYTVAGGYASVSGQTDTNYLIVGIYQNTGTLVISALTRDSGTNTSSPNPMLSPKTLLAAVGDTFQYKFTSQAANKGMVANSTSFFEIHEV